jgi:hypothetical protein
VGNGHRIQVRWAGSQTTLPTGALDPSAPRRTRYFFEILVDGIYYYGNRFLTSPDPRGWTDDSGNPILSRTDLIVEMCADRVAQEIAAGNIDSLPNDLGRLELLDLLGRAGRAGPA